MHSLALALQRSGHIVSGSDDQIYEPARSRLQKHGILPEKEGWFPERITPEIDSVILGMHAKMDNPELAAAQEQGIPIQSFPEFIARQSGDKKRVVVAGSHGKTTVTSIIMQVLRKAGSPFDYMVGSSVPRFDHQVQLTNEAPVIILEGDEYLSSAIDRRPKFLHYNPNVCVITGLAWDHMNVFPTEQVYKEQFGLLMGGMQTGSQLIVNERDKELMKLVNNEANHLDVRSYRALKSEKQRDGWHIEVEGTWFPTALIGAHNMENLMAANLACTELGISSLEFFSAIADYAGPARRLERVGSNEHSVLYNDFAHAPSKVEATVNAVREQFPDRQLIACLELHTFSSLNKDFLPRYKDVANEADHLIIFLDTHALKAKGVKLTDEAVQNAFGHPRSQVVSSSDELIEALQLPLQQTALLMMSSGNFGGLDIESLNQLAIK